MKKYIRSANKFTNKVSQLVSKKFSEDDIREKAATGTHGDETMAQVFNNIIHDPDIEFGEPDKDGNQDILYKGKNIGWINFQRGMGDINGKAYSKLQKYVEPEIDDSVYEDEDDEDYDVFEY